MIPRRPFGKLIRRQLELFGEEHAALIEACDRAERAYDAADREGAEERYSEYLELVEQGAEALAGMRDAYAATLVEPASGRYEAAFNHEVSRRLPRFGSAVEEI